MSDVQRDSQARGRRAGKDCRATSRRNLLKSAGLLVVSFAGLGGSPITPRAHAQVLRHGRSLPRCRFPSTRLVDRDA